MRAVHVGAAEQAFLTRHEENCYWLPDTINASMEIPSENIQPNGARRITTITIHKPTKSSSCGILLRSYETAGARHPLSTRIDGVSGAAVDAGFQLGMDVLGINGVEITGANMACEIMKEAIGEVALSVACNNSNAHVPSFLKNTLFLWAMWILIASNYLVLMADPNLFSSPVLFLGHLLLGLHSCSLYRTLATHPGLVPENWIAEKSLSADECSAHGGVLPAAVPHFVCRRSKRRLPHRAVYVAFTGEAFLFLDQ